MQIPKEIVKTDILIIGGGPSGLMAAIRAADLGVKNIVVAEKSNTRRSGSGSMGNDDILCYIPEYHGNDTKSILKEVSRSLVKFFGGLPYMQIWLERSFELVKIWDSWGIAFLTFNYSTYFWDIIIGCQATACKRSSFRESHHAWKLPFNQRGYEK